MSNRRKLRPGAYKVRLRESAAVLGPPADVAASSETVIEGSQPTPIVLHETWTEARTEPTADGARQLVQIIDAGWGSSGFYSPDMLAEAGRRRVFAAGTHMYLDHPTESEDHERPERSVRDLAAVLTSDATYDPARRALVAEVRVFADYAPLINEKREHIGLSIRANGVSEYGEAEGRRGVIVKEITEAVSVDYVTKAGRGGKVLALLESTRTNMREARSVGAWLESRLHLALTQLGDDMYGDGRLTRDERITLSSAIGDALQVWTARVEADAPQLFTRDLYDEPTQAVEVNESTTPEAAVEPATDPEPAVSGAPVTDGPEPAAPNYPPMEAPEMSGTQTGPAPGTAGTATAAEAPTVSAEARVEIVTAQLGEAQSRITALEAQNAALTSERDTARTELRRMRNVEAARGVCANALDTHTDLPSATRNRIVEAVTRDVPVTTTGDVDTAALTAAISRHVEAEQAYIAQIREAAGEGTPTGLGGSTPSTVADVGQFQQQLADRFAGFGLTESAAFAAAKGRGF
ncbi:hypothetical protein O7626_40005 [Micromonospora sp. WMMD1102]|uniref:hypothetical protein n=1 Tax=Micromonospora sp. WMMD1102 TaxID=3016105 RepID=UPI002414FC80|nr:hypothetical protein [Micromonospora sp. WMMD1102]MDG4792001.1 hypothetical protein [Micromonospora sp. WMMD1102]